MNVIVGQRLRARRQTLGLSQRKLGEILGITFQQIQKYELGKNRIAVATLVRAAGALDAPLAYFLDGVGPELSKPQQPSLLGQDAAVAWALQTIEDRKVRAAFRTLIRALAQS